MALMIITSIRKMTTMTKVTTKKVTRSTSRSDLFDDVMNPRS